MIQWTRTKTGGLQKTGDESHPSDTIIHWSERDPKDPRRKVAITCHQCHEKSYLWRGTIGHPRWSGLCSGCIQQRGGGASKFTHDEELTWGTIHWGERDPNDPSLVKVTCKKCDAPRFVRITVGAEGRTGACPDCGRGKRTGKDEHHTGTIINWDKRDPEDPKGNEQRSPAINAARRVMPGTKKSVNQPGQGFALSASGSAGA